MKKKILLSAVSFILTISLVLTIAGPALAEAPLAWILEPNPVYKTIYFPEVENRWIVSDENGLCGVIDSAGNIIIPLEYDNLKYYSEEIIMACKDSKYGLINASNCEVIIPLEYDYFDRYVSDKYIIAKKDGKYGLLNLSGGIIIPFEYDFLHYSSYEYELIDAQKDGKYGLFNSNGEIIIPFEYDYLNTYYLTDVIEVKKDGKYGSLNLNDEIIIPCEYDYFDTFHLSSSDVIEVEKDGKYGLLNSNGKIIIPCEYDFISYSSNGCIIAKKDGKYGTIDINENIIIPFEYHYIDYFFHRSSEEVIKVQKYQKYGLVNTTNGKVIIPCEYDALYYDISVGYIEAKKDGKCSLFNLNGETIIPFDNDYDDLSLPHDGFLIAKKSGKYGMLNFANGETIIPFEYDDLAYPSSGYIKAKKDGKYGFINIENGAVIIPFEYDGFNSYFDSRFLAAWKNGKYGLINKANCEIIIPSEYSYIYEFEEKYVMVKKSDDSYTATEGMYDKNGNIIIPCEYTSLNTFNDLTKEHIYFGKIISATNKDSKCGLFDIAGNVLLTIEYLNVSGSLNTLEFGVETENGCGILDVKKAFAKVSVTCSVGGTADGSGEYTKGSEARLTATANTGYKFAGWYINEELISSEADYSFSVNEDIDIEARFSRISSGGGGGGSASYTVKLDTNGGSKLKNISVKKGQKIGTIEVPEKEGFIFDGWYSDKECTKPYDKDEKVTSSTTLYAGWKVDPVRQIVLTVGKKDATVWNKEETNDVEPVIKNNRTMLPIRFVAEALGAEVEWDSESRIVTITNSNTKIEITIGKVSAVVNGKEIELDSPAFIESSRTFLPLRFVSENLGAEVEWHEDTKQIVITRN